MEVERKSFQGVYNIIRFNWHFYLFASLILIPLLYFNNAFSQQIQSYILLLAITGIISVVLSLVASFYTYDYSNLYRLEWLPNSDRKKILNINAGFDETSKIIQNKFPKTELTVCDFYDQNKHTEVSIRRARKAYPPYEKTISVSTEKLPFQDNSFDCAIAILSAHEIRSRNERITFFKEISRVTKTEGQILVTEHLRDLNNFMAYTIGVFHFHSKSEWLKTFELAGLLVENESKPSRLITTFTLVKNGNSI